MRHAFLRSSVLTAALACVGTAAPAEIAPLEEEAAPELAGRLRELSALLRDCTCRAREAADLLLAPDFKGGPLTPTDTARVSDQPGIEASGADGSSPVATYRNSAFRKELTALVADFTSLSVAEFVITALTPEAGTQRVVRTSVRFELTGPGKAGGRARNVGRWQMRWRRAPDGVWRVIEWVTLDHKRPLRG